MDICWDGCAGFNFAAFDCRGNPLVFHPVRLLHLRRRRGQGDEAANVCIRFPEQPFCRSSSNDPVPAPNDVSRASVVCTLSLQPGAKPNWAVQPHVRRALRQCERCWQQHSLPEHEPHCRKSSVRPSTHSDCQTNPDGIGAEADSPIGPVRQRPELER